MIIVGSIWQQQLSIKRHLAELFPIHYVRIGGIFQYLDKDAIQYNVEPLVLEGFFSANVQEIRDAVLSLPWVDKTTVKHSWPDTIDIKVYEQVPYIRWGEQGLLNKRGESFIPNSVEAFKSLAMITAPEGYEKRALETLISLELLLIDYSLEIKHFTISERLSWQIELSNGVQILLGRKAQLKNFQRFLTTFAVLGEQRIEAISQVDLRYPNGFAIRWREGYPIIKKNKLK